MKTKHANAQGAAPAEPGAPPPASTADEISSLWDRERELLAELSRIHDPIERAPDMETALAAIERREQAHRELEATRAVKRHLMAQQREAESRATELGSLRTEIAELEARLPGARERDAKEGSRAPIPGYAEQVLQFLERRRQRLADLEAGGPIPTERRVWR